VTNTDYDFLTTEGYFDNEEYASQRRSQQRRKLQTRVRNALLDLSVLARIIDDDELDEILASELGDPDEWDARYPEVLSGVIALLYRATTPMIQAGGQSTWFDPILMRGVALAVYDPDGPLPHAGYIDVTLEDNTVNIDFKSQGPVDLERIGESIAAGDTSELTREELAWFVDYYERSGEFDSHAPAEYQEQEMQAILERQKQREEEESDPNDGE
jgi:hypothetical protein